MASTFTFDREFDSDAFLSWASTTAGAGSYQGINDPNQLHYVSYDWLLFNNDVALVPIALFAGQTVQLDVDFGTGGDDNVDAELWVINAYGTLMQSNDDGGVADSGSNSGLDPLLEFTPMITGLYYIAVSHFANDYLNDKFKFNGSGHDLGDFQLDIATADAFVYTIGTSGADNFDFTFDSGDRRIQTLGGNDHVITGDQGYKIVDAGTGNDTVIGGAWLDQLFGGSGDDTLSGAGHHDVLVGGSGDDVLSGGGGADQLFGGRDGDRLTGGAGNDLLRGEHGDDVLTGGAGDDTLDGGGGQDTAAYTGSAAGVTVKLTLSGAQDTGGAGADILTRIENLTGSGFADVLGGDSRANVLSGGGGNDKLTGGGSGDVLIGGPGRDVMTGGLGTSGGDTFVFKSLADFGLGSQRDVIRDFQLDIDLVDLQGVDANATMDGNQSFVFIAGSFTNVAGQLRVSSTGVVAGDVDGDGVADLQIGMNGVVLSESDFLL